MSKIKQCYYVKFSGSEMFGPYEDKPVVEIIDGVIKVTIEEGEFYVMRADILVKDVLPPIVAVTTKPTEGILDLLDSARKSNE